MNFSLANDIGPLGGLVIFVLLATAGIVVVWLLALTKQLRDEVVEEDVDHKGPIL